MGLSVEPGIVILGVVGLLGNTLAVIIGSILTARNARRSQASALESQIATARAAEDLALAQKAAADAARQLVISAKETDSRLTEIQETAQDTNRVAKVTHKFVDGQRTEILRKLAKFARRVANEHPRDLGARRAAEDAEEELAAAVENFTKNA